MKHTSEFCSVFKILFQTPWGLWAIAKISIGSNTKQETIIGQLLKTLMTWIFFADHKWVIILES